MSGPGPTCPACGVTVLAGYTRCPKCKAPLPAYGGGTRAAMVAGGTAVEDSKFPVVPLVLVGLAVVGGILFFALRKSGPDKPAEAPVVAASVSGPPAPAPPSPGGTIVPNSAPTAAADGAAANARAAATAVQLFETSLKKQHLWASAQALGTRVDVRSALCGDASMQPAFEAARETLRAGGFTEARCLENSGRVVFTRAL